MAKMKKHDLAVTLEGPEKMQTRENTVTWKNPQLLSQVLQVLLAGHCCCCLVVVKA